MNSLEFNLHQPSAKIPIKTVKIDWKKFYE